MLDIRYLCALSSTAAVFFHVSTLYRELDFIILRLLGIFFITCGFLAWTFYCSTNDIYSAVSMTAAVAICFNSTLTSSILLHRIFFHRLRNIPGPFWAKVSKAWMLKKVWSQPQAFRYIEQLHEEYGNIVRVGPRELSILDIAAVPLIYGAASPCMRGPYHSQTADGNNGNIFFVRDKRLHNMRRKAWDKAFGRTALTTYAPRVHELTSILLRQLRLKTGVPVDGTQIARWFAFDVIGEVGMGKSYEQLEKMEVHPAVDVLVKGGWYFGVPGHMPWALRILSSIPGGGGALSAFQDWCQNQMEQKLKRDTASTSTTDKPQDVATYLLQDETCGYGKLPKEASYDDIRLVILGGSDTTASSIGGLMYYLTTNPRVYRKLQSTLDAIFPGGDTEYDYFKATNIPYLEGIINEILRLQPPIPCGPVRTTPREGLIVAGEHIPGDVCVSIPIHGIQRDSRYWEKPLEFIPERWTEEQPELCKDKGAFIPYTTGIYQCAGKPLASLEMRMIVSRIALTFDLEFAEGKVPENYERDLQDLFTLRLPSFFLKFTPRKGESEV